MTNKNNPKPSVSELIERSSLGSPEARAVRQTVPPTVAARLVARSAARGARLRATGKKSGRH